MARKVASETPGSFLANQFSNPANPYAHRTTTAPEIWDQMNGDLDAVVAGVGSGGTITGLAEYFKEKDDSINIVAADPENSIVADAVIKGSYSYEGGSWLVEGVGEDFIPDNLNLGVEWNVRGLGRLELGRAEWLLLAQGAQERYYDDHDGDYDDDADYYYDY